MTITHVGPSYIPAKKTAEAPQDASKPSTPSTKHARSWEAWELSGKTGKWTRIPGRFDKKEEVTSPKPSAPSASGDTVTITPKQQQGTPAPKPAENPAEKKATGARMHFRNLLHPFKKRAQ